MSQTEAEITQTPPGSPVPYARTEYVTDFSYMMKWQSGLAQDIYFDGNDVWVPNLVSNAATGYYSKGVITEGDSKNGTITFPNPVWIGQGQQAYVNQYVEGGGLQDDTERTEFKLYIKDGVITPEETNVPEGLALVTTVQSWWWESKYASVLESWDPVPTDLSPIQVPDNIEWTDYETCNENASELDNNTRSYLSKIGRDGNDFYFKGFLATEPELVMKGTLGSDNRIVIQNGAYQSIYNGCYTYIKNADVAVVPARLGSYTYSYTPKDTPAELVMNFNPATGEITSQDVFVPLQGKKGFLTSETNPGHLYHPTFIPYVQPEEVVIPEGLTGEQWAVSSLNLAVTDKDLRKSAKIEVFRDGNDFYFKGLHDIYVDRAFKGTLSDDGSKITVKVPQYLGDYYDTPVFLYTCSTETTPDDTYAGFNTVKYFSNTSERTVTLTKDDQGRFSTNVNLAIAHRFADPTNGVLKPIFFPLDLSTTPAVPEGAATKNYVLTSLAQPGSTEQTSRRVSVSNLGNDYYFSGITDADRNLTFHGVLQADGKTIKVAAPQYLGTLPAENSWDGDRIMFLTGGFGKMQESIWGNTPFYATDDPEDGFLTFTLEGDDIVAASDFTTYQLGKDPESVIMTGRMAPMTQEMPVIPADATVTEYQATYNNINQFGNRAPFKVNVAVKGDDMWLAFSLPETSDVVIRAKRTAGGVVIEPGQFVGNDNMVNINTSLEASYDYSSDSYTYSATDTPYTFNIDPKGRLIAARTDALIFYRTGGKAIAALSNLDLEPIVKEARTPATAIIKSWTDQSSFFGKDLRLKFSIPMEDKEGLTIPSDELSYRIYFDGELYSFSPDNYPYDFDEATTEIPFAHSGNSFTADPASEDHTIKFTQAPEATVGVQVGHTFNGTTLWNDRVDFDIAKGTTVGQEGDFRFSYATRQPDQAWGTGAGESYDVAVYVEDYDIFNGKQITRVRIPVVEDEGISDYKVWITSDLTSIDGPTIEAQPKDGYLDVTLDEPYTVNWSAYIGYSFVVDDVNANTAKPVICSEGNSAHGLYVKTSRSNRTWTGLNNSTGLVSGIEVTLDGIYPSEAAAIAPFQTIKVQAGDPITANLNVSNCGRHPVNSARYYWEFNGFRGFGDASDLEVEPIYNRQAPVAIALPAVEQPGEYPLKAFVTRVNGQQNGTVYSGAQGIIRAMAMLPVHRVLVEEWTGLWCGWCPRGLYALEWLAKNRPETFVGVSYHAGDALQMADGMFTPTAEMSFPSAMFEREGIVDPFDSENGSRFSAPTTFDRHAATDVPVALQVAADWTDNGEIAATATLTAIEELDPEAQYAVEFVLVGDGIHSEKFLQSNDYSNNAGQPAEMEWWKNQDKTVKDYVYNDVALMSTGGYGLDGSLPASIPLDQLFTATCNFDLAKALNIYKQPLLMDRDKLKVVAFIVKRDGKYGQILNAAVSPYLPKVEGIATIGIDDNTSVVATEYFAVDGRRIARPASGTIVIKVDRLTDGTTRTIKLLVR